MLKIIAVLRKCNDAEQLCILIYTAVCMRTRVCVCMYIFMYVISYNKTN